MWQKWQALNLITSQETFQDHHAGNPEWARVSPVILGRLVVSQCLRHMWPFELWPRSPRFLASMQ